MNYFRNLFLVCLVFLPGLAKAQVSVPVTPQIKPYGAEKAGGEAYAIPVGKDLLQSFIMMGGVDVTSPKIADDYARIMYCGLYKEKFTSDFEWNTIRNDLIDKIKYKKYYYRSFYEISGVIYLGRYNFESQDFPLVQESKLVNVASLALVDMASIDSACLGDYGGSFPLGYIVKLKQTFTFDRLKVPMDEAEGLLAKMGKAKNTDRKLYIRFRVRLESVLPQERGRDNNIFVGALSSVDIFYDREMTRLFANIPLE